MFEAELPILAGAQPAFRRAVGRRRVAARPLAGRKLGAQPAVLVRLDPDPIKEWRVVTHCFNYACGSMAPSRLDRRQKRASAELDGGFSSVRASMRLIRSKHRLPAFRRHTRADEIMRTRRSHHGKVAQGFRAGEPARRGRIAPARRPRRTPAGRRDAFPPLYRVGSLSREEPARTPSHDQRDACRRACRRRPRARDPRGSAGRKLRLSRSRAGLRRVHWFGGPGEPAQEAPTARGACEIAETCTQRVRGTAPGRSKYSV